MTQTQQWKVPTADAILRIDRCPRWPDKRKYAVKAEAHYAIDQMQQRGHASHDLCVYRCKGGCGLWHVGRDRKKRVKKLRKRGLL